MGFRTAAKIDDNQNEIVEAYRRVGAIVLIVSQLKNCFDILVGFRGVWYAIEIKDAAKFPQYFFRIPYSDQLNWVETQLSKGESDFKELAKTQNCNYHIVWDIPSALKAIGAD